MQVKRDLYHIQACPKWKKIDFVRVTGADNLNKNHTVFVNTFTADNIKNMFTK